MHVHRLAKKTKKNSFVVPPLASNKFLQWDINFPSRVVLTFHQMLVLMMGESDHSAKPFSAHPKDGKHTFSNFWKTVLVSLIHILKLVAVQSFMSLSLCVTILFCFVNPKDMCTDCKTHAPPQDSGIQKPFKIHVWALRRIVRWFRKKRPLAFVSRLTWSTWTLMVL